MSEGAGELDDRSERWIIPALTAVFLVCAVLRATGVSWGMPYQLHPDESSPVYQAVQVGSGHVNPGNFYKPTLWPYFLFLLYGVYYVLGRLAGAFPTLAHFQYHYILHTSDFWLIARAAAVMCSAFTVFLVYRAGVAARRTWAGVVGAGLLAVSVRHVTQSHIGTSDMVMILLSTAALVCSIHMVTNGRKRDAALAGIFLGLACAAKYNAILFAPCIALAHGLRIKREGKPLRMLFDSRGWLAGGLAAAAFLAACPWPILDWKTFSSTAFANVTFARAGWWGSDPNAVGWWHYLSGTIARGEGWPWLVAWVLGLVFIFRRRRDEEVLIAVWGVFYFAIVGGMRLVGHRYLLPAFPAIALVCGCCVMDVARWAAARLQRRRVAPVVAILLFAVLAATPLRHAIDVLRLYGDEDFRVTAARTIEGVLPDGTRILSDYWCYAPPLEDMPPDQEDVAAALDDGATGPNSREAQLDHWLSTREEHGLGGLESLKRRRPSFPPRYRIKFIDYPWSGRDRDARIEPWDFYRQNGFRYVILADTLMEVALDRPNTPPYDRYARFLDDLPRYARKVATFDNPHAQTVRRLGLEIPTRIDVFEVIEEPDP